MLWPCLVLADPSAFPDSAQFFSLSIFCHHEADVVGEPGDGPKARPPHHLLSVLP